MALRCVCISCVGCLRARPLLVWCCGGGVENRRGCSGWVGSRFALLCLNVRLLLCESVCVYVCVCMYVCAFVQASRGSPALDFHHLHETRHHERLHNLSTLLTEVEALAQLPAMMSGRAAGKRKAGASAADTTMTTTITTSSARAAAKPAAKRGRAAVRSTRPPADSDEDVEEEEQQHFDSTTRVSAALHPAHTFSLLSSTPLSSLSPFFNFLFFHL
jgi:hypothetical protein